MARSSHDTSQQASGARGLQDRLLSAFINGIKRMSCEFSAVR